MERLEQRLQIAQQTLAAFDETLQLPVAVTNNITRDATIQRFEFSVEATWKLVQLFLREREGLELNSPKAAFRGCFQVSILNEAETQQAIKMVDDRNLTVHTYNEGLAQTIYAHLAAYRELLAKIIQTISTAITA